LAALLGAVVDASGPSDFTAEWFLRNNVEFFTGFLGADLAQHAVCEARRPR
jgi:hypothetical protein